MACYVPIPRLPNYTPEPTVGFGKLIGVVSDIEYNACPLTFRYSVSFNFGAHKQPVKIFNLSGERWLKDNMIVEVDFDRKTISYNPALALIHNPA
jgi:hypothetical protein